MTDETMRDRMTRQSRPGSVAALTRRATLGLPLALAACGFIGGNDGPPLPGKRYDVQPVANGLVADPTLNSAVTLPAPASGFSWAQQGGNAAHDPGNQPVANTLNRLWTADIGEGTGYRHRIPCGPIAANGLAFTMSATGDVRAFSLVDGGMLWHSSIRPKGSRSTNIGGGIGYDDGHIYAATGLGEIICFDAKTGALKWRQPLGSPARSGPTIAGGSIFVSTAGSAILGLDAKTGKTIWTHQARTPQTTLLGLPAPAFANNIVVAGFGSGDLVAIAADTGDVLWTDNLGSTDPSLSQLSAIAGMPVIDQGRVFAGSLGGLVLSLDLPSGRRLWEKDFATQETPFVAGDWVFQLSTDQKLGAIHVDSGAVKWAMQLPAFKNPKKARGPIFWQGPVIGGGSLILASSEETLITVDPTTGRVTNSIDLPSAPDWAPIVVGGKILLNLVSGTLLALG